jgi:hypothetical protein
MNIELDHVFVCASPSAPEAEEFVRFGLHEGLPNQHPGQGTSCRRFGFANTMKGLNENYAMLSLWRECFRQSRHENSMQLRLQKLKENKLDSLTSVVPDKSHYRTSRIGGT